jgi:hypothetical protein
MGLRPFTQVTGAKRTKEGVGLLLPFLRTLNTFQEGLLRSKLAARPSPTLSKLKGLRRLRHACLCLCPPGERSDGIYLGARGPATGSPRDAMQAGILHVSTLTLP